MAFELAQDRPVFTIGVVSQLTGISPKMLRRYEQAGLLEARYRRPGDRRLYSVADVKRLRFILFLHGAKGINLAGMKYVLELLQTLPGELQARIVDSGEEALSRLPADQLEGLSLEGPEDEAAEANLQPVVAEPAAS